MLERFWKDCVLAARTLVRSPLFAAIAIGSIALGIGSTTAVFGLIDAAFLRSRPGISDPASLLDIGRSERGRGGFDTVSYPNYVDYRDRVTQLSGLAAVCLEPQAVALGGRESAERIFAQAVTANYFSVLGTPPSLGRFFRPGDDLPGAEPAVVLSHALWMRRFGADPRVLSRPIVLSGLPMRVVGVAAPGFQGSTALAPDAWVSIGTRLALWPSASLLSERRASWLVLLGRLKPGATIEQAQAELAVIARDLERAYPDANSGKGIRVVRSSRLPAQIGAAVGGFLALLMGVCALVLLVACVNLAGLLLARGAARSREIAIRLAIGGSRRAIVAQVLTETLLLFALAVPAALAIDWCAMRVLASFIPRLPVPLALDFSVDVRVCAFPALAALVTGLATGLVPALRASNPRVLPALKGEEATRWRRLLLRDCLVGAQVALSCVLLVTAALFVRTLQHVASIDPGFRSDGVQLVTVDLSLARHSEASGRAFAGRLLDRVRAIPGVRHASSARDLPFDGGRMGFGGVTLPGRPLPDGTDVLNADWNVIGSGYFQTMGIRLLAGRDFSARDSAESTRVAVVNETTARRLWPGQAAVGQRFAVRGLNGENAPIEVVGVAKDIKYESVDEPPTPFIYAPFTQQYQDEITIHVVGTGAVNLVPAVRSAIRELDPNLPVVRTALLKDVVALQTLPQRAAGGVAGGLGTAALLLAMIGIYGVTAYLVGRRTREMGIRLALGAGRSDVVWRIVRGAARPALAGVAGGLALSLGVSRLLSAFISGVSPADPAAYLVAGVVLASGAIAACYVPARRAAAIDPAQTLRSE